MLCKKEIGWPRRPQDCAACCRAWLEAMASQRGQGNPPASLLRVRTGHRLCVLSHSSCTWYLVSAFVWIWQVSIARGVRCSTCTRSAGARCLPPPQQHTRAHMHMCNDNAPTPTRPTPLLQKSYCSRNLMLRNLRRAGERTRHASSK